MEKYNIWLACIASGKNKFLHVQQRQLRQLVSSNHCLKLAGHSVEFPPHVSRMKTASEALLLSLLSYREEITCQSQTCWPKESSSKALAHLTHFTRDNISSALSEEPDRQIYLYSIPHRIFCLSFPPVVILVPLTILLEGLAKSPSCLDLNSF